MVEGNKGLFLVWAKCLLWVVWVLSFQCQCQLLHSETQTDGVATVWNILATTAEDTASAWWSTPRLLKFPLEVTCVTSTRLHWPKKIIWPHITSSGAGKHNLTCLERERTRSFANCSSDQPAAGTKKDTQKETSTQRAWDHWSQGLRRTLAGWMVVAGESKDKAWIYRVIWWLMVVVEAAFDPEPPLKLLHYVLITMDVLI